MSWQAVGGTVDRKLPSRAVVTFHEVLPARPLTVMVTSSSGRKPAPHSTLATVIGGAAAAIGCIQKRMRACPVCGLIGCGGSGPGQPTGFVLIGLAVIGGHRFGARDGGTSGWPCTGAPSGWVTSDSGPGAAVVATGDPGLEAAREPRLPWVDDVQAAVNSATTNIALNVMCLLMVIGL